MCIGGDYCLLDGVIALLQAEPQKDTLGYNTTPPSVYVPKSVTETWKALLFSKKFSDIKFECQDGTVFHAHKCVLAAASPYFSTAFEGPWGEQFTHADGPWETSNSPAVMEAVLSYTYTGAVTPILQELADGQPQIMLAVTSEYDLSELTNLCEASCARSLDNDNIKSMLHLAHLYGSTALKTSCFDFVQKKTDNGVDQPVHGGSCNRGRRVVDRACSCHLSQTR
jgi:hypothetical protein